MSQRNFKKGKILGILNISIKKYFSFFTIWIVIFAFHANSVHAQTWLENDKVVASNRMEDANFGSDVKTTAEITVIGAPHQSHSGETRAGSVYVFERDGLEWVQTQILTSNDAKANDNFGKSVSISNNGQYIVVGAPGQEGLTGQNALNDSGAVYVFTRMGNGTYTQTAKLVAVYGNGTSDREVGAMFGWDVDIYEKTIVIGAWRETHDATQPSMTHSGAAYIFKLNESGGSGSWYLFQKLLATDRAASDNFGVSVAISDNKIVVGASGNDYDSNGSNYLSNSGACYVFEQQLAITWNQAAKLTSSDRGAGEYFGYSVDISWFWVIAGAPYDDQDGNGNVPINSAGSAFVFGRNAATGSWQIEDKIVANDRSSDDHFGASVAIWKSYAVVGAPDNETDENGSKPRTQAGAAYYYARIPVPGGYNWNFAKKFVASDREVDDHFGYSVDFVTEYQQTVIGSHYEDHDDSDPPTNYIEDAGSVYFFNPDTVQSDSVGSGKSQLNQEVKSSGSLFRVQVAPNPSNGQFELYVSDFDSSKNYILTIYSPLGKKIIEQDVVDSKHSINLESQADGFYIIALDDGQRRSHFKIVKSN